MISSECLTYSQLKEAGLTSYFDSCRSLALKRGYSPDEVLANVRHVFQDGLESSVDDVMWDLVLLVISGGWIKGYRETAEARIVSSISEAGGVDALLDGVPLPEAEEFKHDLEMVGLIDSDTLRR